MQIIFVIIMALGFFTPSFVFTFPPAAKKGSFIIVLDPAGDAKEVGRLIDGAYERTIAFRVAEKLKEEIERRIPQTMVLLTRQLAQTMQPLQQANFANRIDADLYLHLSFFKQAGARNSIFIYRFSYHDDFIVLPQMLRFYPYNQAHLFCNQKTTGYTALLADLLQSAYHTSYATHGPYALPITPLIGISCPAIMLEIGIEKESDWLRIIEPLVEAVEHIKAIN